MTSHETFWEAVTTLVHRGVVGSVWSPTDLVPHLRGLFSINTIRTVPANASVDVHSPRQGDYVKRGAMPRVLRLGWGRYTLSHVGLA